MSDADDAVYAVVLHRYVMSRFRSGEHVSDVAAARITMIANRMGLRPARDVRLLGFKLKDHCVRPLPPDDLHIALSRIRKRGAIASLRRLCRQIEGRTVVELECWNGF